MEIDSCFVFEVVWLVTFKQNIQRNMLNTSSVSSIQAQNRLDTLVGDQSNFQNEDQNNS